MFCSLAQGMVPELGEKLSIFIALAPAVYAGPLTTGFPFTYLKSMKWKTWRRWFGTSVVNSRLRPLRLTPLLARRRARLYSAHADLVQLGAVPTLRLARLPDVCLSLPLDGRELGQSSPPPPHRAASPARADEAPPASQLLDRKPKKFCFMPSPVSSASVFWWTGYAGFSTRGCILDPSADKWFDKRFPPLVLHHGGKDYLVLAEPLLERLKVHETDVQVIRVQKMDDGEHCDFFW